MEQRFGRRGLSIDPMGRFPGEISPAREIYIYIERRVSWAEIEWLRGKTRTGKSYALWFAVHSPLLALHRQPNNITCCTGPRDPSSVQTSSRAQNYRAPLAPHARNVPSEGWSGRPPRLMNFIYLGRASLARGRDHASGTVPSREFYDGSAGDGRPLVRGLFQDFVGFRWFVRSKERKGG